VLAISAGRAEHQARYPEVRMSVWTRPQLAQSALAWFCYLLGYELVFRGVLFLALVPQFGAVRAGVVSTGLYVLAHLRKDAGETWSCFAMGALFCALAMYGGVGAAIALHVTIAVGAELLTVRRNPQIRVR
jgi:membrane protease YdiL (CAAX protease family)